MNIDTNDPKLTAYALGELDDKERAKVEAQIEQSETLRQAVDEIRETANLLTRELENEPALTLSGRQRRAIETEAAKRNGQAAPAQPGRSIVRRLWMPASLAASLLIVLGVGYTLSPLLGARKAGRSPCVSNIKGIGTSEKINGNDENEERMFPPYENANRSGTRFYAWTAGERFSDLDYTPVDPSSVLVLQGARAEDIDAMRRLVDQLDAGLVIDRRPLYSFSVSAGASESLVGGVKGRGQFRGLGEGGDPNGWGIPVHPDSWDHISFGYGAPDEQGPYQWDYDDGPPTEAYDHIIENPFLSVAQNPLSTFSIDVDTASYANIRRFLTQGRLPPPGAVRIEEMINYFDYDYPLPTGEHPFSVNVEVAECPWAPDHLLARIGLKGWELEKDERPPANLVFLIDVSGSMRSSNKLPLLIEAMKMLTQELTADDYVAVAVYAGASGLVLPSTSCERAGTVLSALDRLQAGGSTNGGAGIQLAYDTAVDNFIEGGINRVILATDGDFNVGTTNQGNLVRLIEEKAKSGVFLSVLGFGMGNLKDSTLEKLADKGNGNYAYIDTLDEARKVLVDQMGGTLVTIAKDVKIQVDFNPAEATAYRLIGYENRLLRAEDFNDDTKDAGEIGAGHTVTALYEIIPAGVEVHLPDVDPSKYQISTYEQSSDDVTPHGLKPAALSGELLTVKLRYKEPDGDTSKLLEVPVTDSGLTLADASDDFVFAVSVASFGMLLRGSEYVGGFTYETVLEMAQASISDDPHGYREEFVNLVRSAIKLQ